MLNRLLKESKGKRRVRQGLLVTRRRSYTPLLVETSDVGGEGSETEHAGGAHGRNASCSRWDDGAAAGIQCKTEKQEVVPVVKYVLDTQI